MMLKSASCVCSGLNLFISFYLYKIFKGFFYMTDSVAISECSSNIFVQHLMLPSLNQFRR